MKNTRKGEINILVKKKNNNKNTHKKHTQNFHLDLIASLQSRVKLNIS